MGQKDKRVATFSTTTSYQNAGTMLNAVAAFGVSRNFANGAFRVLASAANPVRICITDGTADDAASKLLAASEYLPFTRVNLNHVYIKSVSGSSTLEFEGDIE